MMTLAVSGSFRAGIPRLNWKMTSPTARYREATAGPVPSAAIRHQTGHQLIAAQESVMGIIAWIVLGLGAGLLANMLIPGRRSQGLIITCVIGIAGALLGGWLATKLFHVVTLHGFFNLSTWLTAIAGAAVLLLAYHLVTSRGSGRSRSRSRSSSGRSRRWAHL
jgi:uncharacterized membrane protein YeaQ/YmgE (transglycosylase-associated protein family)